MSAQKKTFPRTQVLLLSLQLLGDCAMSFIGLSAAYFVRFETPLRTYGTPAGENSFHRYLPLIALGTAFLMASYAYLRVYDGRLLLRPRRAFSRVLQSIAFWLFAFLATTLVFKFEPAISRLFALVACVVTLIAMGLWRWGFHRWLDGSPLRQRITQNVLIVGWNKEAAELSEAIAHDDRHAYQVIGVVRSGEALPTGVDDPPVVLGTFEHLPNLLEKPLVDILVVADVDLPKERMVEIADLCERTYTDFKIIPSFFQIFISNLRLQTVSGIPILGIEDLPIRQLHNVIVKRAIDLLGAVVGLLISAPIIATLAYFIKRESPGPIFYRQLRTGLHGRSFYIYKLRSMRLDAEVATGARWAVKDDPRRTKIGTFMRETNLDELPQFWNVLMGDMSLVGPRPERPELIQRFEREIPHYNPRHEVRPGITGWAQVNGLRGDTSLVERVKYDLYYIENWSTWFDVNILVQTFFRRENAY